MKGIITFYDNNKNELEKFSINKLQYKRDLIISKSIEKYDEEDPCIIYSTFCANILGNELLAKINEEFINEICLFINMENIPVYIKDMIEFEDEVKYLKIE